MSSLDPFCPKTGKLYSEHPSTFAFCPACRTSLQGQIISIPVREKPELIVIEDSPQQAKSALFLPATSSQSHRTKPPPSDAWLKA